MRVMKFFLCCLISWNLRGVIYVGTDFSLMTFLVIFVDNYWTK